MKDHVALNKITKVVDTPGNLHLTTSKKTLKVLGATAAIGLVEDAGFFSSTFTGADAVYTN